MDLDKKSFDLSSIKRMTEDDCRELAIQFTESSLKKVNTLLGEDYVCGYCEGIERFLLYLISE